MGSKRLNDLPKATQQLTPWSRKQGNLGRAKVLTGMVFKLQTRILHFSRYRMNWLKADLPGARPNFCMLTTGVCPFGFFNHSLVVDRF